MEHEDPHHQRKNRTDHLPQAALNHCRPSLISTSYFCYDQFQYYPPLYAFASRVISSLDISYQNLVCVFFSPTRSVTFTPVISLDSLVLRIYEE